MTAVVECEGGGLGQADLVVAREKTHLDENLEAVADADHGLAGPDELQHLLAEPEAEAVAQQAPAAEVVSEREAARDSHDLVILEAHFTTDQPVDMNPVRRCPCHLEDRHGL